MTTPIAFGSLTAAVYAQNHYVSKPKAQENNNVPVFNTKKSDLNGYNDVTKKIDPSKTKVYKDPNDPKRTVTIYCDKDGKEIMRLDKTGKHSTVTYTGKDGRHTILNDFDGDGNVDEMDCCKGVGPERDEYYDDDSDGKFDRKNSYDNIGKLKKKTRLLYKG